MPMYLSKTTLTDATHKTLHLGFPIESKRAIVLWVIIDGYGSKSTNSDLAGFYLLLYICQHAGLFRRTTNVNDVFDNKKIVSCQ
jgi:hypothetical protein